MSRLSEAELRWRSASGVTVTMTTSGPGNDWSVNVHCHRLSKQDARELAERLAEALDRTDFPITTIELDP